MQKDDRLFLMDPDSSVREEAKRRLFELIRLAAGYRVPLLIGKYRGTVRGEAGSRLEDFEQIMAGADVLAAETGTELLLEPQCSSNINNLNTVGECVSWIRKNGYRKVREELNYQGYLSMEIRQKPDSRKTALLSARSLEYIAETE